MGSFNSIEDLNEDLNEEKVVENKIEEVKQYSITEDFFDGLVKDIVEELKFDLEDYLDKNLDKIDEKCKHYVLNFEKEHFENNLNFCFEKIKKIKMNEFITHYHKSKKVVIFKDPYPISFYTNQMYENDIQSYLYTNYKFKGKVFIYEFNDQYRIELKPLNFFEKYFNLKT